MSVSTRILELLEEWADATSAGDYARALAAARNALADPDSRAIPGLGDVFQHMERLSMAAEEPELAAQSARLQGDATRSSECGFCGRGGEAVPRLIAGGDARICSDCVTECTAVFSSGAKGSSWRTMGTSRGESDHCSFCGAADVERATKKGAALICERCVRRIDAALHDGTIR